MHYTWWDALKDFLGALGPLLIAIPWFGDFSLRSQRLLLLSLSVSGALKTKKADLEGKIRERIESPKREDAIITVIGLLCIFLSFVISFVRGIGDLF